jgi:hypothetical protein
VSVCLSHLRRIIRYCHQFLRLLLPHHIDSMGSDRRGNSIRGLLLNEWFHWSARKDTQEEQWRHRLLSGQNAFTFDRVTGLGALLVKNADMCTLALVS